MTNIEMNKIKDQIPFVNQAFQNKTFWKVWFMVLWTSQVSLVSLSLSMGSIRRGEAVLSKYVHFTISSEAKPRLWKLNSVFHHLPSASPKQLCVLEHLECTREVGAS